jgi:hypothetical protein
MNQPLNPTATDTATATNLTANPPVNLAAGTDSTAPKNPPTDVRTTTFSAITATISGSTVVLTAADEVVPLRTAAAQATAPPAYISTIIAALSAQSDISIFTNLLLQSSWILEFLNPDKQYYFFTPLDSVIAHLLAPRDDKYIPINIPLQIAEMPEGIRDLRVKEFTLITQLKGENGYIALGPNQGARIVSLPPNVTNNDVGIVSGLGNMKRVKEQIQFVNGEIVKMDG